MTIVTMRLPVKGRSFYLSMSVYHYNILGMDIKKIQKAQVEILLEVDRICKKYDIKYLLFAGSLLGTVRHKGFIPWDDDIDICLLREDYNKFIEACKMDLDPKYFLQTYETDKNYIRQYAKIRKNNTLFVQDNLSEIQIHHGIFIDIFPMDNVLPNTFRGMFQQKLMWIVGIINLSRVKKICLNVKNPVEKFLMLVCHYITKIIPKNWTDKLQTQIACMFQNQETKYVSHLTGGAAKRKYIKYMVKRDIFHNTIDGEFEGYVFPIPKDYDFILSKIYGDYMTLPPIEERKSHYGIIKVDLDTTNSQFKDVCKEKTAGDVR